MIGTGIYSIEDISVKAKKVIDSCDVIFLEYYTSILKESKEEIEKFLGKKVILATRSLVEQESDTILAPAIDKEVAFLVIGDVFGATTHTDICLRAKEKNINIKVYHNASILTAIGITGLELYKFGKTTSLVFFDDSWKPETGYDVIKQNQKQGLHTLVLLDIKVAEPAKEDIKKGAEKPLPPRFMTVNQGIDQLLEIENKRKEKIFTNSTLCIGCARLGSETPTIKTGNAKMLLNTDFGKPLHCLIVPGKLHFVEEEAIKLWQ